MIELNYALIPKLILGIILIFSAFLLFGWTIQFMAAISFETMLNELNPIGFFGILLMLVVGGIYFLKTALNSIKALIK